MKHDTEFSGTRFGITKVKLIQIVIYIWRPGVDDTHSQHSQGLRPGVLQAGFGVQPDLHSETPSQNKQKTDVLWYVYRSSWKNYSKPILFADLLHVVLTKHGQIKIFNSDVHIAHKSVASIVF
jgi:hypothetical protein